MPTTRSSHDLPIVDGIGFHKLTGSQRSRLVKSTRKLTKILGETPKLQVEQSSPKTTLPPQNGSWVKSAAIQKHPYSPISSITKKFARAAIEPLQIAHPEVNISKVTHSTSGPSSANASLYESSWSRVLLIEAKPKPSFESESEVEVDSRASYISQLSPRIHSPTTLSFGRRRSSLVSITTSKSALFSPTEWEKWMEEREAHSRRKRLSKLTRHLGESIPPDLVFPIAGSSELNKGSSQKGHLLPDFLPIVFPLVSSASEQGHPSPLPKPFISDSLQTAESGGYPLSPSPVKLRRRPVRSSGSTGGRTASPLIPFQESTSCYPIMICTLVAVAMAMAVRNCALLALRVRPTYQ
ncbi:hypothetical protein B0F90DRAFT_1668299 [Multifurca ochricompacta]|uniref:Uncharacterized protein n=1 Tax=Multifurca ochricompacta TaxID=376703 RepID=A0AAD4M3U1_9AGAM|nr:hypothetical protein B0F90DRAFT_1668299 [Multifurca ochricompacta]